MDGQWSSYDTAAQSHERLAVPSLFERPARDLVAKIDPKSASRILDVGTGSGVAALRVRELAGAGATTVGIDPSLEMLRAARKNGLRSVAVASVPGLPFADAAFDQVLASFVLSHLSSYESALRDIVRVLRRGGRFGATSWGSVENEFKAFWQSMAENFIDKQQLTDATRQALPWEDWFAEPDHLAEAFRAAGLQGIEVHRVLYTIHMTIGDFLAIRENSLTARFMRHKLPAAIWERFKESVAEEFHRRFQDPIDHPRDVLIAIGTHG